MTVQEFQQGLLASVARSSRKAGRHVLPEQQEVCTRALDLLDAVVRGDPVTPELLESTRWQVNAVGLCSLRPDAVKLRDGRILDVQELSTADWPNVVAGPGLGNDLSWTATQVIEQALVIAKLPTKDAVSAWCGAANRFTEALRRV